MSMIRTVNQDHRVRCLAIAAIVLVVSSIANAGTPTLQPAMGDPLAGLDAAELARFDAGKIAFNRVFTPAEGLGPIFNQISCSSCHNIPIGGSGSITVTRFGFADDKGGGFDPLESMGGSLLQTTANDPGCEETLAGVGANVIAFRITPSTLGFGLVEAIADADIQQNAITPPPGIAGSVHMVSLLEDPGGPLRVGRFGWKSQVATVLTFSGDAALNEMGITNRLLTQENAPNGDASLLAFCDTVADPEDGPEGGIPSNPHFIDRITDFQRFLAAPPQTPKSGMSGESLFNTIGCGDCHVASFTTPNDPMLEVALRNKEVRAYSDFLLHDMGQAADFIEQGDATGRELRTPPLWGLRVRSALWHDGRVVGGTLADRIAGPGGVIDQHNALLSRSRPSATAFLALTPTEQDLVIAFLDSLGRREFDFNGDDVIDPQDLDVMASCFSGPGSFYTPDDACSIGDVDQDGDIDDDDVGLFLTVYTGSQADCNSNTINDVIDIVHGTSTDCDINGVPDECDPISTDVAFFVSQLLLDLPDPLAVCLFDADNDTDLDGDDIAPFVLNALN